MLNLLTLKTYLKYYPMFKEIKIRHMKLIISLLLIGLVKVSFSQITCNQFRDSLHLTSDTVYLNQPIDTTIDLGIQWMGYTDLSYMNCLVEYNDSTYISISGGTVTGGLFSPYPNPVFFSVNIDYLQQSIPSNTTINAFIDFFQGNMVDTCSKAVTFIINPNIVSVPETNIPELEARIFPNPMTSSSTIEVSDDIKSGYNIIIYDIAGKVIHSSENLSDKTHRLNRSYFKSSGVYFIEIKSINMKSKLVKLLVK